MFTQTPENYQSLYSELQYQLEMAYAVDMIVYINDSESGESVGVKKFYSGSDMLLNVAPIIKPFVSCQTPPAQCGFIADSNQGCITIELDAYEVYGDPICTTDPLTFTLSRNTENSPALLSTFAQQRLIAPGERDLLTILCQPNKSVSVEVTKYVESSENYYTWESSSSYLHLADSSGVVAFALVVDSDETCDKIEVSITQQDEELAAISYYTVQNPPSATRLAWVSSRGAVEHYTFAEVKSRSVTASSHQIALVSAYETYATRAAIAEVMAASQVWLFADGKYHEVEVVSEAIDTAPLDEIALVELTVEWAN